MNYASHSGYLSDERLSELAAQGAQARRECRTRSPSPQSFSNIATKAYQRGWDAEDALIESVMRKVPA